MNRTIPAAAALAVVVSLLTACSPADACDIAAGTHPVAVAQVAPERPSGGTSGGRSFGSRSSSKPTPSKPRTGTQHSTTGGHSHHDHDDCDTD
ncbi:hypothetical protein [Streptomyces sp. NPDC059651]|uniref:hypothetical protein n=1 Tax=Streptomyces sp. NPDC059651 TaxID=3346897 RepID=UPI0036BD4930